MKFRWTLWLLVCSLALPLCAQRKYALLIGNSAYAGRALRNTAGDVALLETTLRQAGFDQVRALHDLSAVQMEQAIQSFTESLTPGSQALFYFAGYGVQIGGTNYLLPVDFVGTEAEVRYTAIPAEQVQTRMEQSGARDRVIVLDACRDNPFPPNRDSARGLAEMRPARQGTLIAFSTAAQEVARDNASERNSLFTQELAGALRTPGLTLDTVFRRVQQNVSRVSRGTQVPAIYVASSRDLRMAPSPAREDPAAAAWALLRDSTDRAALQRFLAKYPNSTFAEVCRRRLDELVIDSSVDVPAPDLRDGKVSPLKRYPTIEAPSQVRPETEFSVLISLTGELITPEVQASRPGDGAKIENGNRLVLDLPDRPSYKFDVILLAGDFEILGDSDQQQIQMSADGDSTPARFRLKARNGSALPLATQVQATFWYEGRYLARASRPIRVALASSSVAAPTPGDRARRSTGTIAAEVTSSVVQAAMEGSAPDMTILVLEERRDGIPISCTAIVSTRFHPPAAGACVKSNEFTPWLEEQYRETNADISTRAFTLETAAAPRPQPPSLDASVARLKGFGQALYRRFAPEPLQRQFWAMMRQHRQEFHTIQVITDEPLMPWELMLPVSAEGEAAGFLGTDFQVARWHIDRLPKTGEFPPVRLELNRLTLIAPKYEGPARLSNQNAELAALQRIPGSTVSAGRIETMQGLLASPPAGIVHFAGHGGMRSGPGGVATFAIQLEDGLLDLNMWEGFAKSATSHPLYFLNACQVGQSNRVAHFVDGWAPTVLDKGASGFIGGIWPVSDSGASDLAIRFYKGLADGLSGDGAEVSELLRVARRRFFETGDPSYLGYVFYGDVHLRVVR